MTKEEIVEELSKLSVLEVAGLVKALEEKWGVSAAAPVAGTILRRPETTGSQRNVIWTI